MSKRVVIHLRPDVPVECDFLDAYAAMPRRAEWVRRTLLRGFVEEQRRRNSDGRMQEEGAFDGDPYDASGLIGGGIPLPSLNGDAKGDDR
ncbi:MAG: hypothetical protein KI792_07310 [Alphaproteobacteria bacterium]|nr:hypothetical protein [Alphaproteobacteria bacterium SS10]